MTEPEPLPADDALWDCPNLIISPHYAGSGSPRSVDRLAQGVVDNIRRLQAGQPMRHVVS